MPFVLPSDPAPGNVAPASWGDAVRAGLNYLANPPACRVYHSASQSIPNNTDTALLFNSERYDTDSMHSTSVATGRITFNTAGLYIVGFNGEWDTDTDILHLRATIRLDGATVIGQGYVGAVLEGTQRPLITVVTTYKMSAGQYAELFVFQKNTSAGASNLRVGANFSPEFWATWVGLG